jgi:hypothetical protein
MRPEVYLMVRDGDGYQAPKAEIEAWRAVWRAWWDENMPLGVAPLPLGAAPEAPPKSSLDASPESR